MSGVERASLSDDNIFINNTIKCKILQHIIIIIIIILK